MGTESEEKEKEKEEEKEEEETNRRVDKVGPKYLMQQEGVRLEPNLDVHLSVYHHCPASPQPAAPSAPPVASRARVAADTDPNHFAEALGVCRRNPAHPAAHPRGRPYGLDPQTLNGSTAFPLGRSTDVILPITAPIP